MTPVTFPCQARRTYPAAATVRAVLATRPFVPHRAAEGDAVSDAGSDAESEPEAEAGQVEAAPPPPPEPPGDETLAAMPESELAAMFSMPQYEHTQPLDSFTGSLPAVSQAASEAGGGGVAGHKRRRMAGGGASRGRGAGAAAAGFSFAELLGRVQCSEAELRRALADVQAMRLGDAFVAVPEPLAREVATAALRCIAAAGLSVDAVPVGAVAADLASSDGLCAELAAHALECTLGGTPAPPGAGGGGGEAALRLGFRAVARFVGVGVLQGAGAVLQLAAPAAARAMPVDAFLRAWASGMPVGTVRPSSAAAGPPGPEAAGDGDACAGQLDLALLAGEVLLLDGPGGGSAVLHLPATALSASPPQRFRQLFSLRAKWRLGDLEPFLAPLVTPGSALADLLLAHTRSSQQPDGSRLFSARV